MSAPKTEAGKRLLDAIRSGVAGLFAHDDGPDDPSPIPGAIAAIEAEAIEQERARLVAGVEGLAEDDRHAFSPAYLHGHADALTAVIARIGSIVTDGSECPLCGGVGRIFDITEDVNRALGEGKLLLSPLIRDTEGGTE